MRYFIGTYYHTIDSKNRVMSPNKIRDDLKGKVVITYGFGGCLYIYPSEAFEKKAAYYSSLSSLTDEEREFKWTFFASSLECELDSQGRILLTKEQIKMANITKDVVFVGNDDHYEIWSQELYEQKALKCYESYGDRADIIGRRSLKEEF